MANKYLFASDRQSTAAHELYLATRASSTEPTSLSVVQGLKEKTKKKLFFNGTLTFLIQLFEQRITLFGVVQLYPIFFSDTFHSLTGARARRKVSIFYKKRKEFR